MIAFQWQKYRRAIKFCNGPRHFESSGAVIFCISLKIIIMTLHLK